VLQIPAGFSAALAGGAAIDLRLTIDGNRLGSQTARTLIDKSLVRLTTAGAALSLVSAPGQEVPARRGRRIRRSGLRGRLGVAARAPARRDPGAPAHR
jgi:hypothetical protein